MPRTHRGFCFTVNTHTPSDVSAVRALASYPSVSEVIAGEETAPTTERRHIQGYISFADPVTQEEARRTLPNRAHVRPVRNPRGARRYCTKGNRVFVNKRS